MAEQTGRKAPLIRFKASEAEWADEKIGDVVAEKRRPIILDDQQRYELITVKRRNEGIVSRGHLLGREILVKNYAQLHAGDFVISKRQVVHGATGIVPPSLDGAIVSNEYLTAVDSDKLLTEFLTIIASRPPMRQKFFLSSYGVDIEKLFFDVEDWKKRAVNLPGVAEQARIAALFRKLDQLISLHQRKHEKLVALKKAMLQKMFPQLGASTPEIRFKGFERVWISKTIAEICGVMYGGGTPKTSERKFWKGNIPWIQSSDITDGEVFRVTVRQHINDLALQKTPAKLIPSNSISIVTRVGVGKLALVDFSYTTSQDFLSLSNLKLDPSFAVVVISVLLKSRLHEAQGTSIKGITKNDLISYSFMCPEDMSEQQKIGTYFRSLDELISQHATQLKKFQQIKSACLEKMFV